MRPNQPYSEAEPSRAEVDAMSGPAVIEFGNDWCGHCRRAQPLVAEALAAHPGLRHLKIADAGGKRLGRSFGVKLWPTLVFLKDGKEAARLVRPASAAVIAAALVKIAA
jgi:thioredoxin 1